MIIRHSCMHCCVQRLHGTRVVETSEKLWIDGVRRSFWVCGGRFRFGARCGREREFAREQIREDRAESWEAGASDGDGGFHDGPDQGVQIDPWIGLAWSGKTGLY